MPGNILIASRSVATVVILKYSQNPHESRLTSGFLTTGVV